MVLSGCAFPLRTVTVRSIGGFPGKLITCDMDLTWSLYKAGYRTTFCHKALTYTYDPETFKVYTKHRCGGARPGSSRISRLTAARS
jgi:cellulose synthase/poly-beta-1,6-N-acetylglucosamine synthase-like glycosyltransferase